MSSTTSFSPTPQVQLHLQWRTPHIPAKLPKPLSPVFPSISSPANHSHSFKPIHTSHSLTPKALSSPLAFTESSLDVNTLEESINLQTPLLPEDSIRRILVQDPQWMMPSVAFRGLHVRSKEKAKTNCEGVERSKFNLLRRRQIRSETEAWERTVEEYREMEKEMRERNQAPNLPYVKSLFLGWFEPLRDAIAKQQKSMKSKRIKSVLSSNIELLPADKMAIIVMHKMMGLLMAGTEDGCVSVVQAAMQIGYAIEQEVRIHNYLQRNKNSQKKRIIIGDQDELVKEKEIARRRVKNLIRRKRFTEVQKLLKNEEAASWDRNTLAKLGSHLIELLVETAHVHAPINQDADAPPDIRPAFRHTFRTSTGGPGQKFAKKYGVIECDSLVLEGLDRSARHMFISYVPMLIPPKKWKGYDKGGYLFLPSFVMRTHGSRKQEEVLRSTPEKIMHKVFEALDALGGTKWRINKKLLSVVESLWDSGGNVAGLVDRTNVPLPPKPLSEDPSEIQKWRWDVRKARKINQERHSLRCDTEIKLSVAQKMKDEEGFYYPHNLDFRGRAYPMHPHLNHLSSDLCRGVLEFSEGRSLGKSGLHWLKIHLANLYGGAIKKLPHEGRLAFVDDHLIDIFDSSDNPINGTRWWLTAEDPFQCLAACINLSEALRSSSPINVISHLPIHQDGSCNGLQHYAALGRDSLEAAAVNLVAGDKPADVYTEIAARVHSIMKKDSIKDPSTDPSASLATILIDQVDRKLVKQTVMTSVYGVTYIGAREQIKRRLEEKGHIADDRLRFSASCYAAKVTMKALGELFQAARRIMSWLGDCAKVITSENQHVRWSTPLGLPVVQPYSKSQRHLVRTSLQVLALKRESDMVDGRKQRSAFPPNYVHSLDGSHMMMTAVACKDAGLYFAGVHDSFWTHACDVDRMNQILREKFVELYSSPILEELLEGFQKTYPNLAFPPLPPRGDFNLEEVLESPYFFN